jgi:LPXTG-motif cell wall-anchored protein
MKSKLLIRPAAMLGIVCGMTLAAGILVSPARADEWNKRTILTVNQTTQVRDTVLQPGQYVLRLLDSQSNRHVVQIFNRDQTHIINTVIAIPIQRMEPTGKTRFTFWETPPGTNRALRDWYYPGNTIGSRFPYPKHLQQVAMVTNTETATAAAPAPAPQPASAEAQSSSAEETQSQATEAQQPAETQPAETAQNTTPAPSSSETTTPAQSTPAQLPKTGSPYPAFGLAGFVLIGLGSLLRIRRRAES